MVWRLKERQALDVQQTRPTRPGYRRPHNQPLNLTPPARLSTLPNNRLEIARELACLMRIVGMVPLEVYRHPRHLHRIARAIGDLELPYRKRVKKSAFLIDSWRPASMTESGFEGVTRLCEGYFLSIRLHESESWSQFRWSLRRPLGSRRDRLIVIASADDLVSSTRRIRCVLVDRRVTESSDGRSLVLMTSDLRPTDSRICSVRCSTAIPGDAVWLVTT